MKQYGLTLIELMIVIAIAAILAAMAAPSFNNFLLNQRVKGAAEGLVAALYNAKAEAVKTYNASDDTTGIVFKPAATSTTHSDWCYGMTDVGDDTCDCNNASSCTQGSYVDGEQYKNVTMWFNSADNRTFTRLNGSSASTAQQTVIFSAGNNIDLGVTMNAIGRVVICRPSGTKVSGYTDSGACP